MLIINDTSYSETSTSLEHPSIVQPVFPYVDNKHPSPQPQERPDHPDYDKDHFMAIACLAFQRSKDPNRKVYTNNLFMHYFLCTNNTSIYIQL